MLGFKADASKAQEGWLIVSKQSERYVFSVTKSDCMESQASELKVKKKKRYIGQNANNTGILGIGNSVC